MATNDLETLNGAARAADEARRAAATVVTHVRAAGRDIENTSPEVTRYCLSYADSTARAAYDAANQAFALLLSLGAERPGKAIPRDKVPLELLDTTATRDLLAALDAVVSAARLVDRERGWVDDDGVGIGFEETFAAYQLQLRTEIFGPVGSGKE